MKIATSSRHKIIQLIAVVLTLASCASAPITPVDPQNFATWVDENSQPSARVVTQEFSTTDGSIKTIRSKDLEYRLYVPATPRWDGLVLIAHGFLRSKEAMDGWGSLLASQGYRAVTMSFVNSSLLGGNHDLNTEDLLLLANFLAPEKPRIYLGFSAGGLSAVLAKSEDPLAVGLIGLDAVDSGKLAMPAAKTLSEGGAGGLGRLFFLWGEPAPCNAENNMKPVIEATLPGAFMVSVPNASHCHFENPFDPACADFCGDVSPPEVSRAISGYIQEAVLSFLSRIVGG